MKSIFIGVISILILSGCLVDKSTEDNQSDSGLSGNTQNGLSRYESVLGRTLITLNNEVLLPRFVSFKNDADALYSAIQNNCENLEDGQSAWKQAMSTWQQIQSAQFGPMTENGDLLAGRIYSWPDQVSTCTVDRQVILSQESDFSFDTAPRQGKGLDALEYLLFNDNLEHTCSSFIVETQSWNALSSAERHTQRCSYAEQVAQDLAANAETLVQEWQSYQNNLININESDIFLSAEDAVNRITDALFFLDTHVKDRKLAAPLGLHSQYSCQSETCSELLESSLSEYSLANIQQNLIGFKQVFIASQDPQSSNLENQSGFDYHLAVRNFPEVSNNILALTDQAIQLSGALDRPLSEYVAAIRNNNVSAQCINASSNRTIEDGVEVCALHGMIKGITDYLKTDFLILMRLSLPVRVEGDND